MVCPECLIGELHYTGEDYECDSCDAVFDDMELGDLGVDTSEIELDEEDEL